MKNKKYWEERAILKDKLLEKDINKILKRIYDDNATIRRYLIEYGFFDRSKDCSKYWVKE